ncbi:shTK domain protein [Oesophagostomum dentatum]|uniref:ShTK domain protein n=1 Tax=Oesophagostomum dentatum TaxID=61180 RepID=A0A0B1SU77_OESDE|nr:shTK domain protein [Oesophagostomum dentatum]
MGTCPRGYTCLQNDECCEDSQVVLPPEECKDFMEHCDSIRCDHVDFAEFARANCARTCNFCFENSTLPPDLVDYVPEYACTDILDDCSNRMDLCRDIDFMDMMAVYCPRSCMLCTYATRQGECQELIKDCGTRDSKDRFCTTTKTSAYQKTMGCGVTCGKCSNVTGF